MQTAQVKLEVPYKYILYVAQIRGQDYITTALKCKYVKYFSPTDYTLKI